MLRDALIEEGIDFQFQRFFYSEKKCYIADFLIKLEYGKKLVVEVDGKSHNKSGQYDWERTVFLTSSRGCKVIRFKNEQIVNDLFGVVAAIKSYNPIIHSDYLTQEYASMDF